MRNLWTSSPCPLSDKEPLVTEVRLRIRGHVAEVQGEER